MDQTGLLYLILLGGIIAIGGLILLYLYWAKKNRTKQKPQAKRKSNEYSNEEIIEEVVEVQPVEVKQEVTVKEDPKPQPQPVQTMAELIEEVERKGRAEPIPINQLEIANLTAAINELASALKSHIDESRSNNIIDITEKPNGRKKANAKS